MIRKPVTIEQVQKTMEQVVKTACGATVDITIYERRDSLIQVSMLADTEADFGKGLDVMRQVENLMLESTDVDVFEGIPLTWCAYFLMAEGQ